MKALLAAFSLFLAAPMVFGCRLISDGLPNAAAAEEGSITPGCAGRTGMERGSLEPGSGAQVVPVQMPEGLPEGMPGEEKPSDDENKKEKAPTEEGEEPPEPQEEVP
ncbi:hypothetical protein [Methylacidimicrobium tartarophylax]|uniref:Secreted protein n=1 Tax=Methylacidimicrobium tartarophylax TaxID=1041768 RepID=A0A5E6MAB9_9BACT|nr:hypothetical protein [Methylacidimicrobium tartarophylax]VVM06168.1 hypothetical protein MAMT_01018 [Methylacidimicrobium tartarophylax]